MYHSSFAFRCTSPPHGETWRWHHYAAGINFFLNEQWSAEYMSSLQKKEEELFEVAKHLRLAWRFHPKTYRQSYNGTCVRMSQLKFRYRSNSRIWGKTRTLLFTDILQPIGLGLRIFNQNEAGSSMAQFLYKHAAVRLQRRLFGLKLIRYPPLGFFFSPSDV